MSVARMSMVWDMKIPPEEKLVLMAIADCCNDDGVSMLNAIDVAEKCQVSAEFVRQVADQYSALTQNAGLQ